MCSNVLSRLNYFVFCLKINLLIVTFRETKTYWQWTIIEIILDRIVSVWQAELGFKLFPVQRLSLSIVPTFGTQCAKIKKRFVWFYVLFSIVLNSERVQRFPLKQWKYFQATHGTEKFIRALNFNYIPLFAWSPSGNLYWNKSIMEFCLSK